MRIELEYTCMDCGHEWTSFKKSHLKCTKCKSTDLDERRIEQLDLIDGLMSADFEDIGVKEDLDYSLKVSEVDLW